MIASMEKHVALVVVVVVFVLSFAVHTVVL